MSSISSDWTQRWNCLCPATMNYGQRPLCPVFGGTGQKRTNPYTARSAALCVPCFGGLDRKTAETRRRNCEIRDRKVGIGRSELRNTGQKHSGQGQQSSGRFRGFGCSAPTNSGRPVCHDSVRVCPSVDSRVGQREDHDGRFFEDSRAASRMMVLALPLGTVLRALRGWC